MTENIPEDSALWVYGRLSPEKATRFYAEEVEIANGAKVETIVDGIAVWSRPGAAVARSLREARELLGLIVASYALITRMPLDLALGGWVEATNASFDGTVVGFTVDTRGHKAVIPPDGRKSRDMRTSIALAAATLHRSPWRLAIRDVYAALREERAGSDDAFVFAWRAVEDVRRAVAPSGATRRGEWASLHAHLGTTERAFKRRTRSLYRARHAVAHGDDSDPALISARNRPRHRVEIGRRIVLEAMRSDAALSGYLPAS